MNTWQTISDLFDAVLPLLMLFYGIVLGGELANWRARRKKTNSKPANDKQGNNSK